MLAIFTKFFIISIVMKLNEEKLPLKINIKDLPFVVQGPSGGALGISI